MKKFAFINEIDARYWNVEFINYNENKPFISNGMLKEISIEEVIKYDLTNKPTVIYDYNEYT